MPILFLMGPLAPANATTGQTALSVVRRVAVPVTAVAAAGLPFLPPSIQYPVAAAILAVPAIRLVSVLGRRALGIRHLESPEPPDTLALINGATGAFEQEIEFLRAAGSAAGLAGAFILGGTVPLAAAALAISSAGRLDRTLRVEPQIVDAQRFPDRLVTPEGWEALEAAGLGVFGPDIPSTLPTAHLVHGNPPPYGEGATKKTGVWPLVRSLAETISLVVGTFRRAQMRTEGILPTLRGMWTTIRTNEQISPSKAMQEKLDVLIPQWAMRTARSLGITLEFEGLDKLASLPPDAQVITFSARHASIWPDFLYLFADPRSRPAADMTNFRFNRFMQMVFLAWVFDIMGLPAVPRGARARNQLLAFFDRVAKDMGEFGLRPLFFGPGGRLPRAWEDNGTPAPVGFYANVVTPDSPGEFIKVGGTVKLAKTIIEQRTEKPLYVVIIDFKGTEFVMPKVATVIRGVPFIQPVTTGGRVVFRVADMIPVGPDTIHGLGKRLVTAAKEATGINPYLDAVVDRWAGTARVSEAARFRTWAAADERWYIAVDRIRSIHPSLRERGILRDWLFTLLRASEPDEESLKNLLVHISKTVKATEYQDVA